MNTWTRLACVAMAICLVATVAQAEVIGPPLISRPGCDTGTNYLFLHDDGTATPGFTSHGVVTDWSFYNDNGTVSGNRTIEPVILKQEGGSWVVTGVGATVTTPATMSGVQSFEFNLVAGSAIVGPGYSFAHHDLNNGGSIEYTSVAGSGVQRYKARSGSKEAPGNALTGFSGRDRTYSVQFETWESFATIGDPLIDRTGNDGAIGGLFLRTSGFSGGGILTEWAIFDNDNMTPDRQITPLILEEVGGSYYIRGIGTTRDTDESGEQHFPFDLVAGSALVGPDYYLAWKDGSLTADNPGVADYTGLSSGTDGIRYFGTGHANNVTIGRNLGAGNYYPRLYSIQATVLTPEPTTLALLAFGLGLAARHRRRR